MDSAQNKKADAQARFGQASAPARLSHWVAKNVAALNAIEAVAIVRQGAQTHVLEQFPADRPTRPELLANVANALNGAAHVSREEFDGEPCAVVSVPVRIAGRPGALGFALRATHALTAERLIGRVRDTVLRRLDDEAPTNNDTVAAVVPLHEPPDPKHVALIERQGAALELIAAIVDHKALAPATRALVDALAMRFGCTRVTLGTRRLNRINIQAVSGSADFDARSTTMKSIARALREATLLARVVRIPAQDAQSPLPAEHRALSSHLKSPALLSVPLVEDDATGGAILLERDRPFTDEEIDQLTQLVILSAPVYRLKQRDTSGPVERGLRSLQRQAARWLGPDRMVAKLGGLAVLALVGWSSVHHEVLSIHADAAIEAGVQRAVVAGADGYITQVDKRAGDVVYQGDVLARLDVEDLQLERLNWENERDKLAKEQRATLAQRDRTRVRLLSAQRAQAQAQIDFLDAQISRAVLRAPIDGVVVAGDLSEALGSPVTRGQLLFEVASLRDYQLVLSVDESDIGDIAEGFRGRLKLRSMPNETLPFIVTRITPVSDSGDGRNAFRLEANLEQAPAGLRPGMEGIAKIEAGERPIGAIWTRGFVRWARLQLWRLGLA